MEDLIFLETCPLVEDVRSHSMFGQPKTTRLECNGCITFCSYEGSNVIAARDRFRGFRVKNPRWAFRPGILEQELPQTF